MLKRLFHGYDVAEYFGKRHDYGAQNDYDYCSGRCER
jgi:hypothetical protein